MQGLHFETPWCWISYGYQLFRSYESHPKCHIEALRKWTAMKGFRVPSVSLATSSVHRGSSRDPNRICTVNWNPKFLTPQESWSNSERERERESPCACGTILQQWDPFSSNLNLHPISASGSASPALLANPTALLPTLHAWLATRFLSASADCDCREVVHSYELCWELSWETQTPWVLGT